MIWIHTCVLLYYYYHNCKLLTQSHLVTLYLLNWVCIIIQVYCGSLDVVWWFTLSLCILHCSPLHYITLHYITLQYAVLHVMFTSSVHTNQYSGQSVKWTFVCEVDICMLWNKLIYTSDKSMIPSSFDVSTIRKYYQNSMECSAVFISDYLSSNSVMKSCD